MSVSATAPSFSVVHGRMVRDEPRPAIPPPAEFVRWLVEHGDPREAMHGLRDLLHHYTATWAVQEGVPPAKAQREAMALLNEATATADELQREAM